MSSKNEKITFSHISERGSARMVNVSEKNPSRRMARAEAFVLVGEEIAGRLKTEGGLAKGNVQETARIAGIMAAKKTPDIIPMCHPLPIDAVEIDITIETDRVRIESRVFCEGKTGVEMEAMTAAAVSALTVYDMVKSAGKGIEIGPIRLLEKEGGKSGRWIRGEK
jgi:cyclic pyranopterin phosphate synthase